MAASAALKEAHFTDLLITRVRFPVGTPHGAALARMARHKRPEIKVLFAAAPEMREHTDGLGEFMPMPVDMQELVEVVAKMLDRDDQAPS
jgi:hypothetical protein